MLTFILQTFLARIYSLFGNVCSVRCVTIEKLKFLPSFYEYVLYYIDRLQTILNFRNSTTDLDLQCFRKLSEVLKSAVRMRNAISETQISEQFRGLRIPPGGGRHFKNSPLVLLLLATPLPRCTSQPVAVIASLMPYLDFIGRSFKTWLRTPTQGRFIFRCNCGGNFSRLA